MVTAPFRASFDRHEVMDFADISFHYESSVLLYKKPSAEEYKVTAFYRVVFIFYLWTIANVAKLTA